MKAFALRNKATGEQYKARSGKTVWESPSAAKVAFSRHGVLYKNQSEYEVVELTYAAPVSEPAINTQAEASEAIAKLTIEAESLIREAECIADEHEVEFHFDVAYGMGGCYRKGYTWDGKEEDEMRWVSSSEGC